jgi:hypothetical protein
MDVQVAVRVTAEPGQFKALDHNSHRSEHGRGAPGRSGRRCRRGVLLVRQAQPADDFLVDFIDRAERHSDGCLADISGLAQAPSWLGASEPEAEIDPALCRRHHYSERTPG